MRSVKYVSDHHQYKGVYKVMCSYGKYYIEETGCSFQVRIKEHRLDIKNTCTCTSVLANHSNANKHHVFLEDAKILAKDDHYSKHRIREAIEIIKHLDNLNRDECLEISENWLPLINNRLNM
jgi:hypothetical protein